jgi:acylphosphatase
MKKCLRITFSAKVSKKLYDTIQTHARKLNIEGTAQHIAAENKVKVMACGEREAIDSFLDFLHKENASIDADSIEVEPFLKEKDYRGVFRIIE